jgi:hypothetical protein
MLEKMKFFGLIESSAMDSDDRIALATALVYMSVGVSAYLRLAWWMSWQSQGTGHLEFMQKQSVWIKNSLDRQLGPRRHKQAKGHGTRMPCHPTRLVRLTDTIALSRIHNKNPAKAESWCQGWVVPRGGGSGKRWGSLEWMV